MADYTIINTAISAIQSSLETNLVPADFKFIRTEIDDKLLNYNTYPICYLLLDTGNIASNTRLNMDLHVIGLFHEHTAQNLTKTITDTMEKTIAYLRDNFPQMASNESIQVYVNQNVLDPFIGVDLPLMPPLGGFRLTYPNFRVDLQTNTT